MNNPPEKYIIAWGNPADGFEYIGTFDDNYEAIHYAESHNIDDWWIILLQEPATDSTDEHQETQEWLNAPMGKKDTQ